MMRNFLLSTAFCFALISCEIVNPSEKIPSYLYIDNFTIEKSDNFNSNSHRIVDAWVTVNNSNIGIYELPTEIPVLEEGNLVAAISPGIYSDGLKGVRIPYPFYEVVFDTLNFISSQTTTLIPKTKYKNTAVFVDEVFDDFESGGIKFKKANGDPITLVSDENAFEGYSAYVYGAENSTEEIEILGSLNFKVPNDRKSPVFLEINYNSSIDLKIGVYAINGAITNELYEVAFFPTENEWRKAYVDMGNEINSNPETTNFVLFFKGNADSSGVDYIGIDNVRLIYSSE